jgi:hypothetical protein
VSFVGIATSNQEEAITAPRECSNDGDRYRFQAIPSGIVENRKD